MKACLYCAAEKADQEFSDEHIWPDALGGDFLPKKPWRTDEVCKRCNSLSGLYVDGQFIKSWLGAAERATGAYEYMSPTSPEKAILPLDYMGRLPDVPTAEDEVAELWIGPCGANIVHIHADLGEQWEAYAGGDPRASKDAAGRAYLALTTTELFWILASLSSFKSHFKRARRIVTNMEIPPEWRKSFLPVDRNDPVQARDMVVVEAVLLAAQHDTMVRAQVRINNDVGDRFLCKLGLSIGYQVLGPGFLATDSSKQLRMALKEPDHQKRKLIPVRGTGFLSSPGLGLPGNVLQWPGGWILVVKASQEELTLSVVSPSGRDMTVVCCDQRALIAGLDSAYADGLLWLTIPSLGRAVGPLSLLSFLEHQNGVSVHPDLDALAQWRHDPSLLPPCSPASGETVDAGSVGSNANVSA